MSCYIAERPVACASGNILPAEMSSPLPNTFSSTAEGTKDDPVIILAEIESKKSPVNLRMIPAIQITSFLINNRERNKRWEETEYEGDNEREECQWSDYDEEDEDEDESVPSPVCDRVSKVEDVPIPFRDSVPKPDKFVEPIPAPDSLPKDEELNSKLQVESDEKEFRKSNEFIVTSDMEEELVAGSDIDSFYDSDEPNMAEDFLCTLKRKWSFEDDSDSESDYQEDEWNDSIAKRRRIEQAEKYKACNVDFNNPETLRFRRICSWGWGRREILS